jgi:hypothetical protein
VVSYDVSKVKAGNTLRVLYRHPWHEHDQVCGRAPPLVLVGKTITYNDILGNVEVLIISKNPQRLRSKPINNRLVSGRKPAGENMNRRIISDAL